MVLLSELPPEILQNVLSYVDPVDLAWIPRTCRALYGSMKNNGSLFKKVYLANLDTPSRKEVDWELLLKNSVKLRQLCASDDIQRKRNEFQFVYSTIKELLINSIQGNSHFVSDSGSPSLPPRPRVAKSASYPDSANARLLSECFSSEQSRIAFLSQSFLFERARGEVPPDSFCLPSKREHQQSAELHCLYGVPILQAGRTRGSKTHPYACSKVYDLREYTQRTHWGPFMDAIDAADADDPHAEDQNRDRVDWEKVEAIMIVLGANLRRLRLNAFPICRNFWDTPFAGVWPGSYMPLPRSYKECPEHAGERRQQTKLDPGEEEKAKAEAEALDRQDPYGVSGTWLRVVCFLDYSDFFAFNFVRRGELPRNVPRESLDAGEATRLILMKIYVTSIEPPGPDDGQELPIVWFRGISRSLDESWDDNANSDLRGCVRLTRHGDVRWTTWSIYNEEERWRSESIQVGGVKSAKGVIGNWFDKDYDERGPAGPTAFWKVSDRVDRNNDRVLLQDFLPIIEEMEDETYLVYEEGDGDDDDDDEMTDAELEGGNSGHGGGEDEDEELDDDEVEFEISILAEHAGLWSNT